MSTIAVDRPQLKLANTSPASSPKPSHLLDVDTPERDFLMAVNVPDVVSYSLTASNHPPPTDAGSHVTPGTTASYHNDRPKYMVDRFPLITTMNLDTQLPNHVPHTHLSVGAAHHMAQVHNAIIRALSSIYNNCLTVAPSTDQAKDFLFFTTTIAHTLHHHHQTEDDFMWGALENLLEQEGALQVNAEQHASFMDGLNVFTKYVETTSADEYNGLTLQRIIDSFAPKLIAHFHDEIPSLLTCHKIQDETALKGVWDKAEQMALKDTDMFVIGPLFLGCSDKSFSIDGMPVDFPGFPPEFEQQVAEEFAKKYQGAWEFCPIAFDGTRKTLA